MNALSDPLIIKPRENWQEVIIEIIFKIHKVRDITLYHCASLCIRKAAPGTGLRLAEGSNIAAICNMLFESLSAPASFEFFAADLHRSRNTSSWRWRAASINMFRSVEFSTHHTSLGHAFSIAITNSTLPFLTALMVALITIPISSCWKLKPGNTSHMRSKSLSDWWWRSFNSYIWLISEAIIKTTFSQLDN